MKDGTLRGAVCQNSSGGLANMEGSAALQSGANEIILAVDRGSAPDYHADIAVFVNGEKCLTFSGSMSGVTFTTVSAGRGFGNAASEATIAMPEAEIFFADDVDIREVEAVLLPEPTVLALLALGVAGLTLRRKVA